ncbi:MULTISPECIES: cell division protein FtsB [Burkholderia]|uniref:Cell division protein FtsB n=1 Tax=Burkholderia humptydooensis TaxID=430531 RepID=A0A7U4SRW1_9BURK|nr:MULTISPECIES: cell division protein FtsB [Burkholderia]AGK47008.1 septum formation initiator family protein [Burkholderia thailandensis MSMB121]ATF36481.1 cell division protein FtsB [Burkholderia thailandensis]AJY41624.1 septum formation initiator family protein [Burkholderia sp. 2002721687]ALX42188.1 cell division protein FtsB [Burkholderia humptydooensis]KST73870.1 cell division protein FtsB [Burkholderia humptydooensis]
MRLVTVVLIALLVVIQYPLWWGHGGWLRVHELRQQLNDQLQKNADAKLRNERIAGEVQDLQSGTSAIEERARYEMGMVKDGEVFVQFVSPNSPAPAAQSNAQPSTSTRGEVSAAPMRVVPNPVSRAKPEKRHGGDKAHKPAHG